ncbi:hypothetical protein C0993_010831 [Termitomyces sp. T159_Od127]|nr:hypothetical protein C0993_010831 [Termitomyces sp. T159_Od127]
MKAFLSSFLIPFLLYEVVLGATRTSPPAGAIIVRAGTNSQGEFSTLAAAVASLPNDNSVQSIFIFPGIYTEQVDITRSGPLTIYGYTTDTQSYSQNEVTLQAGVDATSAGSDDASGTLRIHKDDFNMYNVNVKNTFGPGVQAIAISQYGSRVGLYACGFFGYQDTLYANEGTQVYLKNYIEGAVDFIFGRHGLAFFSGNTIAVAGPGCITANGRESDDDGSYVFDSNEIILASDAMSGTADKVFFGRPWGAFAKVIFKNTNVVAPLNNALWSVWNPGDERISNVTMADFQSFGPGVQDADRPSFVTELTSSEAAAFSISSAVGSDWATWVDASYL